MKEVLNRFYHLLAISFILPAMTGLLACQSGYGTPTPTTSSPPASGNTVTLANFAFSPATLTVEVGTMVTWTNNDSTTHTVTSGTGVFESGNLALNATYTYVFAETGTFSYYCSIHPSMKGTVIVE